MIQEHAKEIFDLVPRDRLDIMPVEELVKWAIVGQGSVTWHRAKFNMMVKLGVSEEEKKNLLFSGQNVGKLLLDLEARIGELYKETPSLQGQRPDYPLRSTGERRTKEEIFGSRKRGLQAQAISNHPEAVAEIIKEAEENEDIPTKTAVLNKIKLRKYEEKHERELGIPDINKVANSISDKLTDCYTKLVEVWPYKEKIGITTRQFIKQTREKLSDLMEG